MKSRREVSLAVAIVFCLGRSVRADGPGTSGAHAGSGPEGSRPTSPAGPCESLDGEIKELVLTESDRTLAKLFVSTALFTAKYKEVGETPTVKELMGRDGYRDGALGSSLKGGLTSLGYTAVLFGGTGLLVSVAATANREPGFGSAAGVFGSFGFLASATSAEALGVIEGRLADRAGSRTEARAEALKASVREGISEVTDLYAGILQWSPREKERFNHLLSRQAVEVITETVKTVSPGEVTRAVQARLTELDPIRILEQMHPDRKAELATLRDLRRLGKQAAESRTRPVERSLPRDLRILRRAALTLSEVNRELPPDSAARSEGERLQMQIEQGEKRLREICELQWR